MEFEIENRISVYVRDNASNINTAVRALVKRFQPGESEKGRRSRCCGHIINLAAKVFILGADYKTFIDEIEVVELATTRDEQNLAME